VECGRSRILKAPALILSHHALVKLTRRTLSSAFGLALLSGGQIARGQTKDVRMDETMETLRA